MALNIELRPARTTDAQEIAILSKEFIESGLGWSWRAPRILRNIRDPETVVLVADSEVQLAGFAIMWFGSEYARLNLLAVRPRLRRKGIGRCMIRWLEESALVAGISVVHLEVRAKNRSAQAFYQRLGYRSIAITPGYYQGKEAAVRMARDLWSETSVRSSSTDE